MPPFGSIRIYFDTLIPAQSKRIGSAVFGSRPVRASLGKGAEHDHQMSSHLYFLLEPEDAANQAH